jgi:hypothetical protein
VSDSGGGFRRNEHGWTPDSRFSVKTEPGSNPQGLFKGLIDVLG